jgi:hypothetical protein
MLKVEAKCPECGFRVEISALEHRIIDPDSWCENRGWSTCPDMRAAQTKARTELNRLPRFAGEQEQFVR